MPDTGLLTLSLVAVVVGLLCFLFPEGLRKLSQGLNRTITVLDRRILEHRYVFGVFAFLASYLLFQLALYWPTRHL